MTRSDHSSSTKPRSNPRADPPIGFVHLGVNHLLPRSDLPSETFSDAGNTPPPPSEKSVAEPFRGRRSPTPSRTYIAAAVRARRGVPAKHFRFDPQAVGLLQVSRMHLVHLVDDGPRRNRSMLGSW